MACIPPTRHPTPLSPLADASPAKPTARPLGFLAPSPPILKRSSASSRSILCRSSLNNSGAPSSPDGDSGRRGWNSLLNDAVRSAVKRWDDYFASYRNRPSKAPPLADDWAEEVDGEAVEETADAADWDWDRWKRHFADVEEEERIVTVLKAQLRDAVAREDYKEAAKLKLAIITASEKDAVGTAISDLNRAIAKEHYKDAAFFRDHAGTGMVGWWAGIAEDTADPYGRIIRISAEHGKYVARSYSSRQLATGRAGAPLFEIFFTENEGEYKRQAVYLRWSTVNSGGFQMKYAKTSDSSSLKQSDKSAEGQNDSYSDDIQSVEERDDDSDVDDGVAGIQNILRDMIPGVKVKVLKVVSPGKVDRDLIAKVVEQIMDEEDEGDDEDVENIEAVDSNSESDIEEIEMDVGDATGGTIPEPNEAPMKFVIGTLMQNLSSDVLPKEKVRVPARIESRDRLSFSFSIEQEDGHPKTDEKENGLHKKVAAYSAKQSADLVMSDLAKVFLSKEKIPMKVLRDVGQLITSAINQNQNHQTLSGKTFFNRIEIPTTSDPLSGLYVGAHGMHTSEILHLKRKFGQWKVDDIGEKHNDLEFYEYVEALKLTGGLSVPAGQVVFRAKVGKHYQLPHKGIIPEEFGVVARYKGQGRIADPGFQNPRWVDGELVILDGKYVRGGPVIGFVYWAPEYHFLVFFNRLKLPD